MPAFQVLRTFEQKRVGSFVTFDPHNPEHMVAYLMLTNNVSRGQHPTLRFNLEHPYLDVVSMMQAKIARAYVQTQFKTDSNLMTMIGQLVSKEVNCAA